MGLFICEAIRFQEDGALARMAIRKVLDKFETYTPPSVTSSTAATIDKNNPFYDVFVTNAADIIFPLEGGKQRQLAVMGLSDSKTSTGMTLRSQHERAGTKTEQPHTTPKIQGLDQRIDNGEILDILQKAFNDWQLNSKEDLRKNWEGLKTKTQKTEFIKKTIVPTLKNMGYEFTQVKLLEVFPDFLEIETSRDDEEFS